MRLWSEVTSITTMLPSDHSRADAFSDDASQMEGRSVPNVMWTHLYSVLRSWNCTFAAACSWWRLTRAWGGVAPEMLICFLAERAKGATKGWVRYSYLRGGASHRGSWGIQQAAVAWLAGGESWEFISGQQTKTSQSLNLQTPQTQHKKQNWQWDRR